jgi:hypothetical protein
LSTKNVVDRKKKEAISISMIAYDICKINS